MLKRLGWVVVVGVAAIALGAVVLTLTPARQLVGKAKRAAGKVAGRQDLPLSRVLAAVETPQSSRPVPILRYHEVVQPRRLDAWTIIGPGGGGTFYTPVVSPHDPKLVFATSDMTQCFVTENGGVTWREFNLRSPCLIVFDPKLPNRVYAKTNTLLWRSDDRGHNWELVFPTDIKAMAYAEDEAEPHVQVTVGDSSIHAFTIDPEDSKRLFLIFWDQLRVSEDAGKTWRVLKRETPADNYMYVDPTSPPANRTLLFVGLAATGRWDGTKYTGGLREAAGGGYFSGHAIGIRPGGKPVLYTISDFRVKNGLQGGVFTSDDNGATWRSLNEGILKLIAPDTYPEFSALATSYNHPEVLYASFFHLNLPNDQHRYYGVLKSSDGGKTWAVVRKEEGEVAENMHDSWLSQAWGPDFGEQPLGIGVDPHNPDLVYTTDLGRIMKSTDGGKTWEAMYSQGTEHGYTTTGLDVTTCYGVHFDPFDAKRMFITYTDIGLFRSEDGGHSWISSSTRNGVPRAWWNTAYWVEFDPQVRGRMWAAMGRNHDLPRVRMFASKGRTAGFQGGVVVSEDGGKSWSVSSKGLPSMAATHILLDPKSSSDARGLYVTGFGRGVFKSTDGGKSWAAKNKGLPEAEPLAWRMAMDRNGTLYVVTVRRAQDGKFGTDGDGWVFRSRDGAETWERLPLPPEVNGPVGITVDPKDPERLYVSAWGRYAKSSIVAPPDGGVYLSTDGGQHWKNILDMSRRIYDVTVDPADPNIVYAAGFEASAWRSADRGQTWHRIRGFNFKDGHRVIIDPADHSKIYITTFGSSVWHGPAAGDPQAPEDIAAPVGLRFDVAPAGAAKH